MFIKVFSGDGSTDYPYHNSWDVGVAGELDLYSTKEEVVTATIAPGLWQAVEKILEEGEESYYSP